MSDRAKTAIRIVIACLIGLTISGLALGAAWRRTRIIVLAPVLRRAVSEERFDSRSH